MKAIHKRFLMICFYILIDALGWLGMPYIYDSENFLDFFGIAFTWFCIFGYFIVLYGSDYILNSNDFD